jgi:UDPglucose--hexose-1-phosphate uridylyltransferase
MVTPSGWTELRKDPVTNRWVLVQRGAPLDHGNAHSPCPFCPGHEAATPKEIAAYRTNGQPANSAEWLVRVIPERAPLLQIEGEIQREGLGVFDRVSGRGASEILIEHPTHHASWDTMAGAEVEQIFWMYRQRVEDLYRDRQIRSVLAYRQDRSALSTIQHPFSRILGAPIVFDDIREELRAARDHYARKQRCLYCDIVHQEICEGERIVDRTPHFLVYAPYGSRRPCETWIVPLTHRHRFEEVSSPEMADLATTVQTTMRRLHTIQPGLPVVMALHTSPNAAMRLRENEWRTLAEDFHWHVELFPTPSALQGIGGFHVNPIAPEIAARLLRSAV